MNTANKFTNMAVVASAIEISTEILLNVSGGLVSSYMDGSPLSSKTVSTLMAAELNNIIEESRNA